MHSLCQACNTVLNLKKANSLIRENLQKLQENEKMKDDFINIAAHELRTPIQPILGLSDLINRNLQNNTSEIDKSELKEDIKVIYRNAKKLQKLTDDILDVSRIDSHVLNLNISRFDFVELIENTIQDFTTNSEKKKKMYPLILISMMKLDQMISLINQF